MPAISYVCFIFYCAYPYKTIIVRAHWPLQMLEEYRPFDFPCCSWQDVLLKISSSSSPWQFQRVSSTS